MPRYLTIDEARGLLTESVKQASARPDVRRLEGKDTFLSHSSKDNQYVPAVQSILEGHGGRVYVDLGDDRLPEPPSVETATILRNAVRATKRFVLMVSAQSRGSIWVPWELGLADGQKGEHSVAVFPLVDSVLNTKWTEQEYLGLYPRIVYGGHKNYQGDIWMVWKHWENTATELSQWIKGG